MAGPTNKQRLEDHDGRIAQIETTLGLTAPKPKSAFRQFRDHVGQQIKAHWKSIVPTVALVLAITGWFTNPLFKGYLEHKNDAFNSDVDRRIQGELNKPEGVLKRLETIQATVTRTETTLNALQPFIHDVIQHQFDSAAKLSSSALQERLPAIQHLAAVAENQGIKVDAPALDALGRNLSTVDTKAAGFWPTAAEFINYRSQIVINDIQNLMRSDLPKCTDHDPTPMELIVNSEDEKKWKLGEGREADATNNFTPARYENCLFTLDSPEDAGKIPFLRDQESFVLTFRHCQIAYRGGPIKLLAANPAPNFLTSKGDTRTDVYAIKGQTVHFENCLFVFAINSKPPKEGQRLTEQLLAQSGSRLTVTTPKSATHS